MTRVLAHNTQFIMNHKERVFIVLVACLIASIGWYAYSVGHAVMNVVTREDLLKQIQQKSTQVSDLETTYFSLKNSVSLELALKKGFKEAPVSLFISKKSLGQALTMNHDL